MWSVAASSWRVLLLCPGLARWVKSPERIRRPARVYTPFQVTSADDEYTQGQHAQAEVYYQSGRLYGKQEHSRDAIEAYKKAVALNPSHANAHYNMGAEYGKLGQHQEAIEAYKQAIHWKSDDADTYYNLGVEYDALSDYQDAVEAFQQ